MNKLSGEAQELKVRYRKVFIELGAEIMNYIENSKPKDFCNSCGKNCGVEVEILSTFPQKCPYKDWQKIVLNYLDKTFSKDILTNWQDMIKSQHKFNCGGCGTCCKLACSEFSYEELQNKAKFGDNFAQQFISVFVPYKSKDEAQNIFPEYFEMLDEELDEDDQTYYYHCPKVTEDNRCSDYENRPQICRDFPDNPLGFLPPKCSYGKWKSEVESVALRLRAAMDIVDFYKSKLSD